MTSEEKWYRIKKYEEVGSVLGDHDIVIVSINEEPRSERILKLVISGQINCSYLIIQLNCQLDDSIKRQIEESNIKVEYLDFVNNSNIQVKVMHYKKALLKIKYSNICIDMTGFSVPDLFIIMKMLKMNTQVKKIQVHYVEPTQYKYEMLVSNNYKYSQGQLDLIEIPGYGGRFDIKQKRILIIILGFEDKVSKYFYESVEPNHLIAINGFPSFIHKYKDISILNNSILESTGCEKIYHSAANNPFKLYNKLAEIIKLDPQANYTIAPIGPKPMSLGACLFQLENQKVKIQFTMPEKFSHKRVSDGGLRIWEYEV